MEGPEDAMKTLRCPSVLVSIGMVSSASRSTGTRTVLVPIGMATCDTKINKGVPYRIMVWYHTVKINL